MSVEKTDTDAEVVPADDVKGELPIRVDGGRVLTMRAAMAVLLAGVIFTAASGWSGYLNERDLNRGEIQALKQRADVMEQRWASVFAKVDRMDERIEWMMKSIERQERRMQSPREE